MYFINQFCALKLTDILRDLRWSEFKLTNGLNSTLAFYEQLLYARVIKAWEVYTIQCKCDIKER